MTQKNPKCLMCGRQAVEVFARGGNVFAVGSKPNGRVDEEYIEYINSVAFVVWRARQAKISVIEDARGTAIRSRICNDMGIENSDNLPEEKRLEWRAAWDTADTTEPVVLPPELKDSPDLPKIPMSMFCYVFRNKKWDLQSPTLNAALSTPPDPRRVAHDREYSEVFAEVMSKCGVSFLRKEIPNKYYKDHGNTEPWYSFIVGNVFDSGDVNFIVGPRKRVTEIRAEPVEGIEFVAMVDDVSALGKRDNVTWEAGPRMVLIHAWTREKLVEYLCAMIMGTK